MSKIKREESTNDRLKFAYSTNPDFKENDESFSVVEDILPQKQRLVVCIERKNRGGKCVTLVKGYKGNNDGLDALGKQLKSKCGVGGTVKDGEIIIQGELKLKVANLLREWGYGVVVSG